MNQKERLLAKAEALREFLEYLRPVPGLVLNRCNFNECESRIHALEEQASALGEGTCCGSQEQSGCGGRCHCS